VNGVRYSMLGSTEKSNRKFRRASRPDMTEGERRESFAGYNAQKRRGAGVEAGLKSMLSWRSRPVRLIAIASAD